MDQPVLAMPSRLALLGTKAAEHPQASASGATATTLRVNADKQNKNGQNSSPPSDDSISAYINHHTSSPAELQQHHRRGAGGDGDSAMRASPRTRQEYTPGERPPSSPSPTPADDEDVAAASRMLSLRASQDLSSRRRDPMPSAWSHRARVTDAGDAATSQSSSAFLVRKDLGDRNTHGEGGHPSHLRVGALRDSVLFNRGESHDSFLGYAHQPLSLPHHASRTEPVVQHDQPLVSAEPENGEENVSFDASQGRSSSLDIPQGQNDGDISGPTKKRRRRTKKEEADVLVSVYAQTAFPDSSMRQKLADQLGMTSRAISIWFQNRRQAERKRATRFGPIHSAALTMNLLSSARPSPTTSRSVSLNSTTALSHAAKLQRWPSLDAIVADRGMRKDSSSTSEEEEDVCCHRGEIQGATRSRAAPSASIPQQRDIPIDAASVVRNSSQMSILSQSLSKSLEVLDDKENIPPLPTKQRYFSRLPISNTEEVHHLESRQPLRDIRKLVFGRETLPTVGPAEEVHLHDGEVADEHSTGEVQNLVRLPLDSSHAARSSARRTPFSRSFSANAVNKPQVSMEQIVSQFIAGRAPPSPRRSFPSKSARLMRFISLSTSKRGRASVDGKLSPPRKRPFAKSLSSSTTLPAALAKIIREQEDIDAQQRLREQRAKEQQGLLAKMPSSSSTSSEEGAAPAASNRSRLLDEDEDEERTLRMAANRRLARAQAQAQAQGRDIRDKADALTELASRPWARSVSGSAREASPATQSAKGPSTRMAPPSLDMAAGRDRSMPITFTKRGVLRPSISLNHPKTGTTASAALTKATGADAPVEQLAPSKKRHKKRKSTERVDAGKMQAGHLLSVADENVPPSTITWPVGPANFTPVASKRAPSSAVTPSGLPSFGTPRTGVSSGSRSFGRSLSAQYSMGIAQHSYEPLAFADEASSSPVGRRGTAGPIYANTPAMAYRSWGGSSANLASTGRDMTPRSLAFALGLTHNSNGFSHQTPYTGLGGIGVTPFGPSSRYSSSRHLPRSSSRNLGEGAPSISGVSSLVGADRAGPYSPLARGREGAMLASLSSAAPSSSAACPPLQMGGKRKSPDDDSSSGGSSEGVNGHVHGHSHSRGIPFLASRNRVPFAKLHSHPSLPQPPVFSTPLLGGRSHSVQAHRSRLPLMASLVDQNQDQDQDQDLKNVDLCTQERVERRSSKAVETLAANGHQLAEGDDSGYVGPSDTELDESAARKAPSAASKRGSGRKSGSGRTGDLMESPRRVQQQRQRQHDAAQVLLGLAGEGR